MNIDKKQLIRDLIHQAENLPLRDDNELDALKRRAEMIIRKVFSGNSKYLDDLKAISFYPRWATGEYYEIESWKSGKQAFINLCKTMLDELTIFEAPEPEKIAIGSIANFFGPMMGNQNIDSILKPFGFTELEGNKTQKIGQVLNSLSDGGDMEGIFAVISSLLKNHRLSDSSLVNLNSLIAPLGLTIEKENLIKIKGEIPISGEKYITIKELPDNFYYDLIEYINRAYSYNIFPAVRILNRKLLENLIVDLLRKRFGMSEIDLFYDTKNGRFHGFNVLLKNMKDKIEDLKPISAAIDHDFLNSINQFRISGNSSAHTIELHVTKEEIDKEKADLMFIVKVLSKAIKSL